MHRRKVLTMLMTAVMIFSSVVPDTALIARAGDDAVAEAEAADEETEQSGDVGEEDVQEAEYKELPAGIKGMPDNYVLTEQEKRIKENIAKNHVVEEVEKASVGVDYAEDTVFFLADDASYAAAVAEAYGAELKSFDGYVALLDLSGSGLDVAEAVALGADPGYKLPAVEPDYYISVEDERPMAEEEAAAFGRRVYKNTEAGWVDEVGKMEMPDPYLLPDDLNYQWWHDEIGTYGAWGIYGYDYSDSGITVAVIDTGVNTAHEELAGHSEADGVDLHGHGSNVAGIIAASADNGKGGAGVAPGVQLIGYTCGVNAKGKLDTSKIVSSVKAAADAGADIINMSLGGANYNANFVEAVNYAYAKDVTIVAAIGNNSSNAIHYPACYDHVISVAAVQPDGSLTTFSNKGDWTVDIAAPGADMMSCNTGGETEYVKMQGTSQASPVVAGACALYMSIFGHVSPDEMRAVLLESAVPTKEKGDGCGILNVAGMLKGDTTGPAIAVNNIDGDTLIATDGATESAVVTADATVKLLPMNFGGVAGKNADTQIFFTVNGKAPVFDKDGRANSDTFLSTDGQIPLNGTPIFAGAYTGGSYVIKAQAVTGMGVASRITTLKLTVEPGKDTEIHIDGPAYLAEGCSATLTAILERKSGGVTGNGKLDKNVSWSITDGNELAGINAGTGVLKANKGAVGTVTVKAVYGTLEASRTIAVGHAPAKSITPEVSEVKLSYNGDSDVYGTRASAKISITEVLDTEGKDITAADYMGYSWVSSDRSVVQCSSSDNGRSVTVWARGKGSATVTVTANDGSGAKAVIKVKVYRLANAIDVSGQNNIALGASATYKATVLPAEADTKAVTWSVSPAVEGVSVDEKGVVSVAASVSAESFQLVATAADGSGVKNSKLVRIVPQKADQCTVYELYDDSAYKIISKKGSIKSLQLYTVDAESSLTDEREMEVRAEFGNDAHPVWKSSNPNVVDITGNGVKAVLRAKSKGSAKITCEASDGSGKKTTFKVNVIVPVAGLQLSNPLIETYADSHGESYTRSYLAVGVKSKTKATAIESYGKASNTKVRWSMQPVNIVPNKYNDSWTYDEIDPDTADRIIKDKLVSCRNGVVAFSKKYYSMIKDTSKPYAGQKVGMLVTAYSTDGTGVSATRLFIPMQATRSVYVFNEKGKRTSSMSMSMTAGTTYSYSGRSIPIFWDGDPSADPGFDVQSSNPEIVSGYYNDGYVLLCRGSKRGTATLTVRPKDGTKKKLKIKITIK